MKREDLAPQRLDQAVGRDVRQVLVDFAFQPFGKTLWHLPAQMMQHRRRRHDDEAIEGVIARVTFDLGEDGGRKAAFGLADRIAPTGWIRWRDGERLLVTWALLS